jgi:hypothetical protein
MKRRKQEDRRIEREIDRYASIFLFLAPSLGECMIQLARLEKEAESVGFKPCVKVPAPLKEIARQALEALEELETMEDPAAPPQ